MVPNIQLRTPLSLSLVIISEEKLIGIIRALVPNISSGWDGLSPRMIKICESSIAKPIKIIFETSIRGGIYPDKWKMSNVCPIHKKESKNLKENYRPISLLPILSKMFDKVIFAFLYDYFIQNLLLTRCQSGFIKGDSCVNQLLSITHDIHKNMDANHTIDTIWSFSRHV